MAAANIWTEIGWLAAAAVLLFNAVIPRRKKTVRDTPQPAVERQPSVERQTVVERAPVTERQRVAENPPAATASAQNSNGTTAENSPGARRS